MKHSLHTLLSIGTAIGALFGSNAVADQIYVSEEQLMRVSTVDSHGAVKPFSYGVGLVYGLALDKKGNVYAAGAGNDTITKITPAGLLSVYASGVLGSPSGIGFDAFGNLYTTGQGYGGTVDKIAPNGRITHVVSGVGGFGLAFDQNGDLFVAHSSTIKRITPSGAISTFASGFGFVWGLAFDRYGNLFASDYYGDSIFKITPDGGKSLFSAALDLPTSLAFDSIGDLFVCNITKTSPLGDIRKITPNGIESIFATGLNYPTGIAISVPEPSVTALAFLGSLGFLRRTPGIKEANLGFHRATSSLRVVDPLAV